MTTRVGPDVFAVGLLILRPMRREDTGDGQHASDARISRKVARRIVGRQ